MYGWCIEAFQFCSIFSLCDLIIYVCVDLTVHVHVHVCVDIIVFILDGRAQQYLSLSQGAAISALVQMESVRERERD